MTKEEWVEQLSIHIAETLESYEDTIGFALAFTSELQVKYGRTLTITLKETE